jgi:hypothetical protein
MKPRLAPWSFSPPAKQDEAAALRRRLAEQERTIAALQAQLRAKDATDDAAPRKIGRPPVPTPDLETVRRLKGAGHTDAQIAKDLGASFWAVRKALTELGLVIPGVRARRRGELGSGPAPAPAPPAPPPPPLPIQAPPLGPRRPAEALPDVLAALEGNDFAAVWRQAGAALQGDYMLGLVRALYREELTAGARVLARVVALRAGAEDLGAEDLGADQLGAEDLGAEDLGAVVLVGGIGRMLPLYRQEAARRRLNLIYVEKGDAAATARLVGRSRGEQLRGILVYTSVCSHPLREAAEAAARAAGAPIVYLVGSPSVLKLRAGLAQLLS